MHLVYLISEENSDGATVINTPLGLRYLRVLLYRGGGDPIEWGNRQARPHETLLNTIEG